MKILLVDDDALIRKSLSITLSREADMEVIGSAIDGAEAMDWCAKNLPDVVLMDIRMPGVDGISATRLLKQRYPNLRIMMLTTFDDKQNIQQALATGADGYLLKTDKIADIAGKLRAMMEGAGVLSVDALRKLSVVESTLVQSLKPREQEIIRLVAQGMTNKEIGKQLFLSEGTIRNQIAVLMEKLEAKNRTQLGMMYYEK